MSVAAILETYTLSDLLELNDLTEEEVVEYLVAHHIVKLPELQPLEFDND